MGYPSFFLGNYCCLRHSGFSFRLVVQAQTFAKVIYPGFLRLKNFILTNVRGNFRNFAMAAAMFMNSNSLPIALMQSLVATVPDLRWDVDDNRDAMVGRALTYLVMHSTLGMVVSVLFLLVPEALLRIYSATLELWCSFAFTNRPRSCRIGTE